MNARTAVSGLLMRIMSVVPALAQPNAPGINPEPGAPSSEVPAVLANVAYDQRLDDVYPEEFQVLNILSSAGASILGIGYVIPVCYLLWSLKWGAVSGPNPWGASGLEWEIASPPLTQNFIVPPRVTTGPYEFTPHAARGIHSV